MLPPPKIAPIPEVKPFVPTKLDDFYFSEQDQIIQTEPIGGSGAGGVTPPLYLVAVDTENVKVTFGQVNGITPTDVNTSIDVSGTDGTWAIYLHADLGADGVPTAVEVLSSSAGTVPSDDADNSYILVGQAVVASSLITTVNTSLAWSQTFTTCGRDSADPETTPGTYFWLVA